MSNITLPKKELKMIVKDSVREAITEQLMEMRAIAMSFVSQKEQKNIDKLYKKPSYKVAKTVEIKLWIGK